MTLPDALIEQAHNVFDSEYRRLFPQGGDASDHDDAVRDALEAVIAEVQADTVRRVVEWLRSGELRGQHLANAFARAIVREFGVTQPEERAA